MDWTHALVGVTCVIVGALAYRFYARYTRRSYWADVRLVLVQGARQRRGYKFFHGRLDDKRPGTFTSPFDEDG